jgi:hypothetical protein
MCGPVPARLDLLREPLQLSVTRSRFRLRPVFAGDVGRIDLTSVRHIVTTHPPSPESDQAVTTARIAL